METPLPHCHETDLAEKLGVERSVLTELRATLLTADVDWLRKSGGIHYLPAGIEKVCTHLHLDVPAELEAPPAKKNGAAVLSLIVTRPARLNRRIVFATIFGPREKDGPLIAVRVRDAAQFLPGQEIRAVMQTATVASLHGPQPRQRGRTRPAR